VHVVDLNGAFAGKPVNEAAIKAIIGAVDPDIPVQVGGGIATSTPSSATSTTASPT